jgi:hypothetical protein
MISPPWSSSEFELVRPVIRNRILIAGADPCFFSHDGIHGRNKVSQQMMLDVVLLGLVR